MADRNDAIVKVFSICILRSDGSRLYSKFYPKLFSEKVLRVPNGTLDQKQTQIDFEKNIFKKQGKKKEGGDKGTSAEGVEIFQYLHFNVIYKEFKDLYIYVIGDQDENELLLRMVLNCLTKTLDNVTKNNICKHTLIQNYEKLILVIDEMLDEGVIVTLETDTILVRMSMEGDEGSQVAQIGGGGAFISLFGQAKNKVIDTLYRT